MSSTISPLAPALRRIERARGMWRTRLYLGDTEQRPGPRRIPAWAREHVDPDRDPPLPPLNDQQFAELLPHILGLPGLARLDLSHHRLSRLPEALLRIPSLQYLYLAHNAIKRIPASAPSTHRPLYLDLETNAITEIPDFEPGTRYARLRLSGNSISRIPDSLANVELQELFLSSNPLTSFPGVLPKLRTLTLADCGLEEVPPALSDPETAPSTLDLARNRLCWIPAALADTGLGRLILSHNPLGDLPERLPKLHHLDLSHCALTEFPRVLSGTRSLHSLNLSYNQIRRIPRSISRLDYLQRLDLRGNPLNLAESTIRIIRMNPQRFLRHHRFLNELQSYPLLYTYIRERPDWSIRNLPSVMGPGGAFFLLLPRRHLAFFRIKEGQRTEIYRTSDENEAIAFIRSLEG